MDRITKLTRLGDLLQEAVSAARATLFAIHSADLFQALPMNPEDREPHNHGAALLSMLDDKLVAIQAEVDALNTAMIEGDR